MNLGTTGHDDYNAYLTEECKRELNRKTDLIDEVVAVWERAGYDVQIYDDLYNPGNKWIACSMVDEGFEINLAEKKWAADSTTFETFYITVKHMGLIDETGKILGWW